VTFEGKLVCGLKHLERRTSPFKCLM